MSRIQEYFAPEEIAEARKRKILRPAQATVSSAIRRRPAAPPCPPSLTACRDFSTWASNRDLWHWIQHFRTLSLVILKVLRARVGIHCQEMTRIHCFQIVPIVICTITKLRSVPMSGIEHSRWVRSGHGPAAANCYDAVTDHRPARFLIEDASGHWPEMQKSVIKQDNMQLCETQIESYEDMMTLTCCQDHIITENIWFVWSKTSFSGDK